MTFLLTSVANKFHFKYIKKANFLYLKETEVAFKDLNIFTNQIEISKWLDANNILKKIKDAKISPDLLYLEKDEFITYQFNDDKLLLISKKPSQEIHYKLQNIEEEGITPKLGNIPILYYYYGSIKTQESLHKLNPIDSNYAFLITSLIHITDRFEKIDQEFLEEARKFIDSHKEEIKQITSSFTQIPRFLGSGVEGSAFDIGNNKVLKIFKGGFTYQKAKEAQKYLYKYPLLGSSEVMIYDVGEVGKFIDTNVYYTIIEKLQTNNTLSNNLSEIIKPIKNLIYKDKHFFDVLKLRMKQAKTFKTIDELIKPYLQKYIDILLNTETSAESIELLEKNYNLDKHWLLDLIKEIIYKYLTDRYDLHQYNIGLTNYGKFKFFDSAYIEASSERFNF